MVALPMVFGVAAAGNIFAATAAKGASGSKEEKGFVDWLLGSLTKQEQFYETDPILKKVEEKPGTSSGTGSTSGRKGTISVH